MNKVKVFRRDDGSIAIRNHLFILPAVVCANQVAIDVARRNPKCKYIEHQHGCAQIGADLLQTQRIFSNLSISPNVFASLFVGLGCEGVMTANLYEQSKTRTTRPMHLVTIQGVGGTLKAEDSVSEWMSAREAEITGVSQVESDWSALSVGVMCDSTDAEAVPESLYVFMQKLIDFGVRVVVPDNCRFLIPTGEEAPVLHHGDIPSTRVTVMKAGSNQLETATGLAAAGVHLILHFAQNLHAFGTPLVPLARFSISEPVYQKFKDDFDGILVGEDDVDIVLGTMTSIVEGQPSAAEDLGMDDFALYRIGPTV